MSKAHVCITMHLNGTVDEESNILYQARASYRLAHAWFLKICFYADICMRVC